MQCIHHADREATVRCTGCAEALCPDCQVSVAGAAYCQACKGMAVKHPPVLIARMELSPQAKTGVIVGLVGLLFFTVVCGVVAIVMGVKARKAIAEDPRMSGGGMAIAAICLGSIDMLFFVLNMMHKA